MILKLLLAKATLFPSLGELTEISHPKNFFCMTYHRRQKKSNLIHEQHQSSDPGVSAPVSNTLECLENSLNINCEPILDDLLIVLSKGTRSLYQVSYFSFCDY